MAAKPDDELRWETERPALQRPVLIVAFEGWNDAGEAATTAVRHVGTHASATPLASIDAEQFFDFTTARPEVRLVGGKVRRIVWPTNDLKWGRIPGANRDVIVLAGVEPHLRWRTFCGLVLEVAKAMNCELVVSIGALLADVPHSRPVPITGTAYDGSVATRYGMERSKYEGPTGILGVLHDAFARERIDAVSLWAAVPHYLQGTPSPRAALALVERLSELLEVTIPVLDLQIAAVDYERQVDEAISGDEEMQAFVQQLEANHLDELEDDDDDADLAPEPGDLTDADGNVPSGDAIAAELERFLREQG
jgi:proteasome assembly chaperone (PAC2) family protein